MNMNKENTYSNLKKWCESYYEKSGLKVHPSSVPVDVVLEDVMGQIAQLLAHEKLNVTWTDYTNARIEALECKVEELESAVAEMGSAMTALISNVNEAIESIDDAIKKESVEVKPKKAKKND